MPKVSTRYLDHRRNEILQAALACFARNGFHETTIQDIAREAGVSHGAIYRYFPSKDDIIEAAAQRDRAARARRFEEAELVGTPLEALDQVLAGYIARYSGPERIQQYRLRAQLFSEGARNPRMNAVIRINRDDVLDRMSAIVRRGQQAGQINPDVDAGAVARVLVAVYDGLAIQQALDPGLDIRSCVPAVSALLLGAFVTTAGREEAGDGVQRTVHRSTA